ncbi:MAG TPA: hypothetical protein VG477_06195 [Thermoanaerobaculia bacterium]|nr:hypothetical protein [Thermoanaerobaculia bacterium]
MNTSPRRRFALVPLVLAAALAVGCGGPSDSETAQTGEAKAPPLDACTLFTYEDAEAIAGEALAAMSSTLDDARGRDPGQCIYNSGTLEQTRILSLFIRHHRTAQTAKRFLESSRSSLGSMAGGNVQDAPGLGDAALWVGGRIQQLHIIKGDRQFIITVQSPDGTDQLPKARQVAEKVLGRVGAAPAAA